MLLSAANPPCAQGAPKVALVDLGLALMDASPEECEDELRRLHITLESMVGCLLPRLHHVTRIPGPASELE